MVTPDIEKITSQSLKVGKYLMFYIPRSIDIEELFDIIYEVTGSPFIFLDVYILESANKIKAILLIYGHEPSMVNLKHDFMNFLGILSSKSYKLLDSKGKPTTKNVFKVEDEQDFSRIIHQVSKPQSTDDHCEYVIEVTQANKLIVEDEDSQEHLLKIISVVGIQNFCEALLKYKDKYVADKNGNSKNLNSLAGKLSLKEIVKFFYSEILTDKQLSRIQA